MPITESQKTSEITTLEVVDFLDQAADIIKRHNRRRKSAVNKSLEELYSLLDHSTAAQMSEASEAAEGAA